MIQKHLKLNPNNIFLDRDGDGITDSIDFQLLLSPSCSYPTVLSAVMDLSACLGFETMGMNLPLVQGNERRDNSFSHYLYIGMDDELKGIYSKKKEGDYFLGGGDKIELAKSIKDFAFSLISKKVASQKRSLIKRDGRREGFEEEDWREGQEDRREVSRDDREAGIVQHIQEAGHHKLRKNKKQNNPIHTGFR